MRAKKPIVQSSLRWFLLSIGVGLLAGGAALAFFELSHFLSEYLIGDVAGYRPVVPRGESKDQLTAYDYGAATIDPWWCLLLPALGGLFVGVLSYRFPNDVRENGTGAAITAFHEKRGLIPPAVIWVKMLTSSVTLGTGGSGGREGPIAQICAAIGSWIAQLLKLTVRERRLMLMIGMAAGVSAIFRAPLAGALFAAEVLYSRTDFESEVIMPGIIACVTSYTVFSSVLGQGSLFATNFLAQADRIAFLHPAELLPYTVLGVVLVFLIFLNVSLFDRIAKVFDALPWPYVLKPTMGGLLTGAFALVLFHSLGDGRVLNVLGYGYAAVQEVFDYDAGQDVGVVPWSIVIMLGVIAVGKIITTAFTVESGGSAGVFGPSMVIGGSAGGLVGILFHNLNPHFAPHPGAFAIVGMASFFAAAAKVPISTLIMVSEITGNYRLLLPAMWVEAITFALCRNVSIYRPQVPSRIQSPAHRGEFIVDMLEGLKVSLLMDRLRKATLVRVSEPLREVVHQIEESHSHYYPVVDEDGQMVGIFSTNDVRRYLHDQPMWDLLVAADLMTRKVMTVNPDTTLNRILEMFTEKNLDEIPVVSESDPGKIVGMLGRREVIAIYNARLAEARRQKEEDA